MSLNYTETVFVLHKRPLEDVAECPQNLALRFSSDISNYLSHSTRAFKAGSHFYFASELRYRAPRKINVSEETLLKVLDGSIEMDPISLGSYRPCGGEDGLLIYLAFKPSKLRISCSTLRPNWGKNIPIAMCVFEYGSYQFEFKDVTSLISNALFDPKDDSSFWFQECKAKFGTYRVVCETHFKKPLGFLQAESYIVEPGMCVRNFVDIDLIANNISDEPTYSMFKLTNLNVVLLELTCFKNSEEEKVTVHWSNQVLRSRLIHRADCDEIFKWEALTMVDGHRTYRLPVNYLDVKIPDVEPTFFSNYSMRCYALSFTCTLEYSGCSTNVTGILDINIASRKGMKRNFFCNPTSTSPKDWYPFLHLERCQRSLFIPLDEGKGFIQTLPEIAPDVLTYDSESTLDAESIHTVIRVRACLPGKTFISWPGRLELDRENYGLALFEGEPKDIGEDEILSCEIQKIKPLEAHFESNYGGLFLKRFGQASSVESALVHAPHMFSVWNDSHLLKLPYNVDVYPVAHKWYKSLGQTIVAIPGMKLSDFMGVRISVPFMDAPTAKSPMIGANLQLELHGQIRGDMQKYQTASDKSYLLATIDSYSHRPLQDYGTYGINCYGRTFVNLKASYLDGVFPDVGSSFYTNKILRHYWLIIRGTFYLGHKNRSFSREYPVLVAKDIFGLQKPVKQSTQAPATLSKGRAPATLDPKKSQTNSNGQAPATLDPKKTQANSDGPAKK